MKKIFLSIISFTSSTIVFAQDSIAKITTPTQPNIDLEIAKSVNKTSVIETLIPLFAITTLVVLVIQVTRTILDYRLKNKIIDRGISEHLATSILDKNTIDKKDDSIKWSFLLCGLGIGLIISYYTMPLNIHSLAIMAFCLAASYLGYFYYLKNQNR